MQYKLMSGRVSNGPGWDVASIHATIMTMRTGEIQGLEKDGACGHRRVVINFAISPWHYLKEKESMGHLGSVIFRERRRGQLD